MQETQRTLSAVDRQKTLELVLDAIRGFRFPENYAVLRAAADSIVKHGLERHTVYSQLIVALASRTSEERTDEDDSYLLCDKEKVGGDLDDVIRAVSRGLCKDLLERKPSELQSNIQ